MLVGRGGRGLASLSPRGDIIAAAGGISLDEKVVRWESHFRSRSKELRTISHPRWPRPSGSASTLWKSSQTRYLAPMDQDSGRKTNRLTTPSHLSKGFYRAAAVPELSLFLSPLSSFPLFYIHVAGPGGTATLRPW